MQQPEGFLIAPRRLIEQRQLARGFGFAEQRAGADRQLDRRAQPRLGERHAPRFPIHHPDDPVGVGLVAPHPQLVENGERGLRVLPGLLEVLAGEVHLGVVQQAQPLQVDVPDHLGELVALPEVAVRVVPEVPVRADHAEVVVGDRQAFLIPRALIRIERALVVAHRLVVLALNRREDAEILLDARAQRRAGAAQRQRAVKPLPGGVDVAVFEIESGQHIDGLGGEHLVAAGDRRLITLLARGARGGRFAAVMVQHAEPAQGLGVHGALAALFGHRNRRGIALHRLRHAARALLRAGVGEQFAGTARPVGARLPGGRQQRTARGQHCSSTRPPRSGRSGRASR